MVVAATSEGKARRGRSRAPWRAARSTCRRRSARRPATWCRCASSAAAAAAGRRKDIADGHATARSGRLLLHRQARRRRRDRRSRAARCSAARLSARRGPNAGRPGVVDPRRAAGAQRRRLARAEGACGGRWPAHSAISRSPASTSTSAILEALGAHGSTTCASARDARRTTGALDLARPRGRRGTATWSAPSRGAPNGRVRRAARAARAARRGRAPPWNGAEPGRSPRRSEAGARQSVARSTSRRRAISFAGATSAGSSSSRSRAAPTGGSSGSCSANDSGRLEADGDGGRAGSDSRRGSTSRSRSKEAGTFLARFGYADAMQGAPTKIDGHLAWSGGAAATSTTRRSRVRFRDRRRPGPVHQDRARDRQAARRAVAAVAAAARSRSTSRDVFSEGFAFDEITGDVRIAERRDADRATCRLVGPAGQGRDHRRAPTSPARRSTCRCECSRRCRRRVGRRGAAVPREPARRRRGRRRIAARAEGAEGSDRADVQLRVRR